MIVRNENGSCVRVSNARSCFCLVRASVQVEDGCAATSCCNTLEYDDVYWPWYQSIVQNFANFETGSHQKPVPGVGLRWDVLSKRWLPLGLVSLSFPYIRGGARPVGNPHDSVRIARAQTRFVFLCIYTGVRVTSIWVLLPTDRPVVSFRKTRTCNSGMPPYFRVSNKGRASAVTPIKMHREILQFATDCTIGYNYSTTFSAWSSLLQVQAESQNEKNENAKKNNRPSNNNGTKKTHNLLLCFCWSDFSGIVERFLLQYDTTTLQQGLIVIWYPWRPQKKKQAACKSSKDKHHKELFIDSIHSFIQSILRVSCSIQL